MVTIEDIEKLLDLSDPEIRALHHSWDKSDCSLVGITEILLHQTMLMHKEEQGDWYDTDIDRIVLRLK